MHGVHGPPFFALFQSFTWAISLKTVGGACRGPRSAAQSNQRRSSHHHSAVLRREGDVEKRFDL